MKSIMKVSLAGILAGLAITPAAYASTATGSFQVTMVIQANCVVQSASNLAFGTTGVIASNVQATSTVGVQCTNLTPYTVGLSAGSGAGATVSARSMTSAANATVGYTVYRDAAHTQNWGVTSGTDTNAGTGNGAVQTFTAYGQVAPQTTPAAGSYSDTLSVTVTY